jgi:curved DNA-binding protein CbpA
LRAELIGTSSPPRMNGQLGEQPLAELIREIAAKDLSGGLRLQHERIKTVVYFKAGQVVYATSNLRIHRLCEYLRKRELISESQLTALPSKGSDLALASKLSSDRLLSRSVLDEILADQTADVLRVGLLWTDGGWSFDGHSQLSEPVNVRLEMRRLLTESARHMRTNFAQSRFRNLGEIISPGLDAQNAAWLTPTEGFVLSRLEGSMKLSDLTALSGLREPEALRTIYGLLLGGFLNREYWPNAFRASEAQKTSEEGIKEPSEIVSPEMAETAIIDAEQVEQQSVDVFLDQLDQAKTYYEVLKVTTSAGADEVKRAYYGLARQYHPDRFHEIAETPLHTRIESAFARIAQAYETLVDKDLRISYDARLAALEKAKHFGQPASMPKPQESRPRPTPKPPRDAADSKETEFDGAFVDSQTAEQRFQEGMAAISQGQANLAITCLSAAVRLVPDEPQYRAYYGRALACHEKTRRLAEMELQAAIKLAPANSSYRVMLAELYLDLGLRLRAKGELERALAVDPQNTSARKLLFELEVGK